MVSRAPLQPNTWTDVCNSVFQETKHEKAYVDRCAPTQTLSQFSKTNFRPPSTFSQTGSSAKFVDEENNVTAPRKIIRNSKARGRQRLAPLPAPIDIDTAPEFDAFVINGVSIYFPFVPYQAQRDYMGAVIHALQKKENALLESPTGTGKTLSLLCSTLAWRKAFYFSNQETISSARVDAPGSQIKRNVDAFVASSAPSETSAAPLAAFPECQIIYSSRTHAQIAQVMLELRRTSYRFVRTGMLASRDQLCINQSVFQSGKHSHSTLTRLCKAAVKKGTCSHYKAFQRALHFDEFALATAVDIEDIANERLQTRKVPNDNAVCPFHAMRHVAKSADILFMPYNYLLDIVTRARTNKLFKLQNSVVIVDEGHNIAQTCEEAASFAFYVSDITPTADEVSRVADEFEKRGDFTLKTEQQAPDEQKKPHVSPDDLRDISTALRKMHKEFVGIPSSPTMPLKPLAMQDIMFRVRKANIDYSNIHAILRGFEDVLEYVEEFGGGASDATSDSPSSNAIMNLETIRVALLMLFFPHGFVAKPPEDAAAAGGASVETPRTFNTSREEAKAKQCYGSYLVTVSVPPELNSAAGAQIKKPAGDKFIRCMCLSPHNALRSLLNNGIRSLIITSGTLSPMNILAAELGIPLQVRIACRHIIESSQISGLILSSAPKLSASGPSGALQPTHLKAVEAEIIPLYADYKNRQNIDYQRALGATIVRCLQSVPGGVLVFFSSYAFMHTCVGEWHDERYGIMRDMKACKRVFVEDRDRDKFRSDLAEFRQTVIANDRNKPLRNAAAASTTGAVLFAVCRGKVSEGIDFPDDCARAVIVIGIPFMNVKEERVILKQFYLDKRRSTAPSSLSGSQWYTREAWVAINQALGRVIRHRNDYGVCILIDQRFTEELERVRRDIRSIPYGQSSNLPRYIHESLQPFSLQNAVKHLHQFFMSNSKNDWSAAAVKSADDDRKFPLTLESNHNNNARSESHDKNANKPIPVYPIFDVEETKPKVKTEAASTNHLIGRAAAKRCERVAFNAVSFQKSEFTETKRARIVADAVPDVVEVLPTPVNKLARRNASQSTSKRAAIARRRSKSIEIIDVSSDDDEASSVVVPKAMKSFPSSTKPAPVTTAAGPVFWSGNRNGITAYAAS